MPKKKVSQSKSKEFKIYWKGQYNSREGKYTVEFAPTGEESEPFPATRDDIEVIDRNLDRGIIEKNVRFSKPLEETLEKAGAKLIGRTYKPKISNEEQKKKNLEKIREIEKRASK